MKKKRLALAVACVFAAAATSLLTGCETMERITGNREMPDVVLPPAQAMLAVRADPRYQSNTAERQIVAEGVKALKEGRLERASEVFNVALKLNVTNGDLHLLNALTYHLMALAGDATRYELAEEGYRIALRFDPTNWLVEYHLGLCYLDQRKYFSAQEHLARAVVAQNRDPDMLLDLAVASYYARDPRIGEGALKRLREVAPERARSPEALRTGIMIKAAMNDTIAYEMLGDYRKLAPVAEVDVVERRVEDWKAFYKVGAAAAPAAPIGPLAQGFPPPAGFGPPAGGFPPAPTPGPIPGVPGGFPPPAGGFGPPGAGGMPGQQMGAMPGPAFPGATPFVDDKMVVVDVVMIGTQEDARETYGINLLNGLKLQFGDPLSNVPGWNSRLGTVGVTTGTSTGSTLSTERTTTITRDIRVPSITYSLNIANALNTRDEIIAKPSLVALAGQTSEFFSGTEISAAAVSGGAGDSVSVQKEIGVKLAVRPEFLPDGRVRIQVVAQRTFLTDPSSSVVFQFRLDTTKTTVNANVVLKYGETLILSGLTERETTAGNNGVPGLRNIPGLNFLFAQRDSRDFRKSILVLLTPRRPIYAAQSPEDRQALLDSLNDYERSIARLEQRHRDWFRPRAVFDEVREKLDPVELLHEFRSGDIKSERWERRDSHGERVNRTLDRIFL